MPDGVEITVDKVTMNQQEYTGEKLPTSLYANGALVDITSSLSGSGAVWYNSWDNLAPSGFSDDTITETSITITVTGFAN